MNMKTAKSIAMEYCMDAYIAAQELEEAGCTEQMAREVLYEVFGYDVLERQGDRS